MCSNLFLSLSGSLINQNFVPVKTLMSKRLKVSLCHQVHFAIQQTFQVAPHTKETQSNWLIGIKNN